MQAHSMYKNNAGRLSKEWYNAAFISDKTNKTNGYETLAGRVPVIINEQGTLGAQVQPGKRTFGGGFGVNAGSIIRVNLAEPGALFIADIGLDGKEDCAEVAAWFQVAIAERFLFHSEPLSCFSPVKHVEVELDGAMSFDLIVNDTKTGNSNEQWNWGNAKVRFIDGSEVTLQEMAAVPHCPDMPFSFIYGGIESKYLLPKWERHLRLDETDDCREISTLILKDPETGLEVESVVTTYLDTGGVDWVLYLTNKGEKNTPVIENLCALDTAFPCHGERSPVLSRLFGSSCYRSFTLDDFQPYDMPILYGKRTEFGAEGVWPSQDVFPFFDVKFQDGGVIVGVGWTGRWRASVEHTSDGNVRIDAGINDLRATLYPGEKIRSPRILLFPWKGEDPYDGYNQFRGLMRRHILPKVNGETIHPPIAFITNAADEKSELDWIDHAAELGFEYYWLDSWWIESNYPNGVGNYGFPIERVPDGKRFPNGLKVLGDAAHSAGMKFLVWFAPESVMPNTYLAREHPEWIIRSNENENGTFDLANRDAREYITRYMNTVVREYGMDCWRTDNGPGYEHLISKDSSQDRAGMTEIRYVESFYALWDDVVKANPHIWIDNCCGGGTRIDLETCSRSISLWRSDGSVWTLILGADADKCAIQNQAVTMSLSRYLPYSTGGQSRSTPYHLRSGYNAGLSFIDAFKEPYFPREQLKQGIEELKRVRKYYFGDFYPLSAITTDSKDWCLYQLHRPECDDGMVMAFRRQDADSSKCPCVLRKIDESGEYEVSVYRDYVVEDIRKTTGRDLGCLMLEIPERPGSMIIEYKRSG